MKGLYSSRLINTTGALPLHKMIQYKLCSHFHISVKLSSLLALQKSKTEGAEEANGEEKMVQIYR